MRTVERSHDVVVAGGPSADLDGIGTNSHHVFPTRYFTDRFSPFPSITVNSIASPGSCFCRNHTRKPLPVFGGDSPLTAVMM